jgi:hypothetical protein
MVAVGVTALDRHPHRGSGRGVEAQHLALVRRAAGAARAAEVQPFEQVRLAGAVGAVHHGQPLAQRDLGGRVRPEVAQAQAGDDHGYTLSRIGMIR